MNRQRQAFSLVEILVTISLMTVLAAISIGNGKSLSSSRQPMAAAQMLEAELKKARALAINQEIPVAVCFSGGSSSGLTQSFYRLQGERPTGPTSSHQFSGELPEAYLCLGYWATASGSAVRAGIPNLCTVADSRNWSTLVNPVSSNDPMIVFAPNGNAYSNGLAYFNGAYHILACNGAECSAAGPPSGATGSLSYFSVNRISHPQTVAISLAGQVWIEPGITDASSVATVEGHIKTASAAAPAPASTSAQAPVIVSTKAEPIPPGQTQALLYPQDHLVLQAEATSPDGSPLKCHWESANGKFSSGVPTDMVYDPVSQTYRSQWEWRPDPTAAATSYTLSCVVESAKGGVSASGASANLGLAVQARNNQYCYFRDYLNPSGVFQSHVSRVRVNGTGERLIHAFTPFDREYITSPAVPSSVLNKLAITTLDDTGGGSIYVCNADGTDFRKVCTRTYAPGNSPSIFGTIAPNIDFMEPVWAPDKKSLVYLDYNPSGFYDLKLVDFRVPNPTPVTLVNGSAAGDPFYPQFTADSDRLVYLRGSYKSWSTIASSNVYRAETCAWKQPGYPTKVLYSNPPNAGIHWGRANLKMMANGHCQFIANGISPTTPIMLDYGAEQNGTHTWAPATYGYQGISFMMEFDPGTGPGTEQLVNYTAPVPVTGPNMTQCIYSPTGDKLMGQVFNPDGTRSIQVTDNLASTAPITVASLQDGNWMFELLQYRFTADGRYCYYYSFPSSNNVCSPTGDQFHLFVVPSDGSAAPIRVTKHVPGLFRRIL